MTAPILTEREFKETLALWLLDHDCGTALPPGMDRAEYAESFRLPPLQLRHTQSYADQNGDLITLLKGEIALRDWETRSKRPCTFTYYQVLKTLTDTPDVEPFPVGYLVVES